MKHEIKMIGLDLDGTTFNNKKEISDRTLKAIKAAIAKGVVVLPATGRPVGGVPKAFTEIPGVEYVLTSNGALIVRLDQVDVPIYMDYIPHEVGFSLIDYMLEQNALVDIYYQGKGYSQRDRIDNLEKYVPNKGLREYIKSTRIVVDDLREYVEKEKMDFEKLNLYFIDMKDRRIVKDTLSQNPRLAVTSSVANNIEINHKTANKGRGLIELGKVLGIKREEIMACGDGGNDYDMLKEVGFSVAMENAGDDLKAVADYVTFTNEEDGVAHAIEKFVL